MLPGWQISPRAAHSARAPAHRRHLPSSLPPPGEALPRPCKRRSFRSYVFLVHAGGLEELRDHGRLVKSVHLTRNLFSAVQFAARNRVALDALDELIVGLHKDAVSRGNRRDAIAAAA